MIVEDRKGDVGEQWREDAALRGTRRRIPLDAILTEDAGSQERGHECQDASVSDPSAHRPIRARWSISSKQAEMSASSTHS